MMIGNTVEAGGGDVAGLNFCLCPVCSMYKVFSFFHTMWRFHDQSA